MFCDDEYRSEYTFTWKIENYSSCVLQEKIGLKSPTFAPDNFCGSIWYLKYYPLCRKNINEHDFRCVLHRNEDDIGPDEISVFFKIDIISRTGDIIASRGKYGSYACKFKRGDNSSHLFVFPPDEGTTLESLNWNKDTLTISCRMCVIGKHTKSEAVTKIGADKISFSWKVNVSDCIGDCFQRRIFSLAEKSSYEITVSAPNDTMEIKIKDRNKSSPSPKPRFMRGEISLLNKREIKIVSQTGEHLFHENQVWDFPNFITMEQLFEDVGNGCLYDETLNLFCEFSVPNGKKSSGIVSRWSDFATKLNTVVSLSNGLSKWFKNLNDGDVKLRTENGTLTAHKDILAARSPVFCAMFSYETIENQLNVVDIPDVDVVTLKSFLEYVYTGKISVRDFEIVLKLLLVSDKYQVLTLKEVCCDLLTSILSVENADEVLVLADVMDLKMLKECTLDFVAAHITEMWNLPKWKDCIEKNKDLSHEVFARLSLHWGPIQKE